ncbi:unnamed protein product [Ceratitis capitata]|uniref:(Mediterranean fruit fly) hypothetical protein n=2 Tax=Ceratitis capitata TaxID=7213 RepID=A0A811TYE0_CERCA|nr:unnamed protein product [Ceratitis capitata]
MPIKGSTNIHYNKYYVKAAFSGKRLYNEDFEQMNNFQVTLCVSNSNSNNSKYIDNTSDFNTPSNIVIFVAVAATTFIDNSINIRANDEWLLKYKSCMQHTSIEIFTTYNLMPLIINNFLTYIYAAGAAQLVYNIVAMLLAAATTISSSLISLMVVANANVISINNIHTAIDI